MPIASPIFARPHALSSTAAIAPEASLRTTAAGARRLFIGGMMPEPARPIDVIHGPFLWGVRDVGSPRHELVRAARLQPVHPRTLARHPRRERRARAPFGPSLRGYPGDR